METEATGTWTAGNGETVDVTLRVLPDGAGRFGGVYVTAATKLSSGRPSSAVASVTVEDGDGNSYDYTPVAPNMGLFAKLPDRFFAADFPVGNGPMPARLKWTVTGARIFTGGAWEECEGEGVTLEYYPAGRFGASGGLLTRYPWRWWWGEDCEAPLPIARELIPTEGNPLPITGCAGRPQKWSRQLLDLAALPYSIWHARTSIPYVTVHSDGGSYFRARAENDEDLVAVDGVLVDSAYPFTVAVHIVVDFPYIPYDKFEFCVGLMTDLDTDITVAPVTGDGYVNYSDIEIIGSDVYPLGFATTGCGTVVDSMIWLRLRVIGRGSYSTGQQLRFRVDHSRDPWDAPFTVFAVFAFGDAPPRLNSITNNYAPFAVGAACRDDILNSPKHRGRLTHMRLPDCAIDYYVKWWDEDGACYVLPYSIIGETTEGRQDGSPLYEATRTLRLASPLLTADERKDAMTIAQSPRVAVRPYGGEWSFARLNDYSVSWEAGDEDEATLQIEIIANYGKSEN